MYRKLTAPIAPQSPLLMTAQQAADALTISPRLLWTLTHNRQIPCIRIGRAVRYDPADLRAWISSRKEESLMAISESTVSALD